MYFFCMGPTQMNNNNILKKKIHPYHARDQDQIRDQDQDQIRDQDQDQILDQDHVKKQQSDWSHLVPARWFRQWLYRPDPFQSV